MEAAVKERRSIPFIGTVIVHGILFLIFIFIVFHTPIPPYPETSGFGVEVALGTSDEGMGDTPGEPANSSKSASASSSAKDKSQNNTKPILSEDNENVYLGDNKKKGGDKQKSSNPNAEYKKGGDKSGGKGITNKPGYQGNPNGNPNSNNYNGEPGDGGDGTSFTLGNRKTVHKEFPDVQNINEKAIVVINIWVDKQGNVTRAERGLGTRSANPFYINKAIDAALKVKWEPKSDAPELQMGKIKYVFSPE
jgi:hypothetical protein